MAESHFPVRSLILLRGLMHEAGHWHGLPDALCQRLPGWRISACDFPGVGDQRHLPPPWSIEAMADAVAARSGAGPHVVVATSLGSMVAAAWAQRHPQAVAGLLLLVPSAAEMPLWARLRPWAVRCLLLAILRRRGTMVTYLVQRMTSNRGDDAGHRLLAAQRLALARQRRPAFSVFFRQLWAAAHFRLPPAPACPVRIITAAADAMVRPACGLIWARRWAAEHRRHPTSGHDLSIDDAPWLVDQISECIRRWQL